MSSGYNVLMEMYKTAKKQRSFANYELNEIENALENVMPFV